MNILYVTTISSTMGFFVEHIKMLIAEGHTVELACSTEEGELPGYYGEAGIPIHHIPFSRSPLSAANLKAYGELKQLLKRGNYDIVHTHTPNASVLVRLACRKLRKKGLKVIYTAHGFHFYKGAPLKNWLLYYPAEKLCSLWTDTLITINEEDYTVAKTKMHAKHTVHVPGVGVDLSRFGKAVVDKAAKRGSVGVPEGMTWVLTVGELIVRKNQETLIRAVAELPNVCLTIAGAGVLQEQLEALIAELGVGERVKLLGYRTDISELCAAADVFSLPSYQEGLSVALMEAMACGLPCVVSEIRGNTDLIDETGGALFAVDSVSGCAAALQRVIDGDRAAMGANNAEKIKSYDTETVVAAMKRIYEEVM